MLVVSHPVGMKSPQEEETQTQTCAHRKQRPCGDTLTICPLQVRERGLGRNQICWTSSFQHWEETNPAHLCPLVCGIFLGQPIKCIQLIKHVVRCMIALYFERRMADFYVSLQYLFSYLFKVHLELRDFMFKWSCILKWGKGDERMCQLQLFI